MLLMPSFSLWLSSPGGQSVLPRRRLRELSSVSVVLERAPVRQVPHLSAVSAFPGVAAGSSLPKLLRQPIPCGLHRSSGRQPLEVLSKQPSRNCSRCRSGSHGLNNDDQPRRRTAALHQQRQPREPHHHLFLHHNNQTPHLAIT